MRRVQAVLTGAQARRHRVFLSLINLGEVLCITERERGATAARRTLAAVDELPVELVPVSRSAVLAAAHIKARFTISYADAFAAAAARDCGGVVMTGDPEFEPLAEARLIGVEWLPAGRA